jgi:hypothetical protein
MRDGRSQRRDGRAGFGLSCAELGICVVLPLSFSMPMRHRSGRFLPKRHHKADASMWA